jgi:hypothetical protein
VSLRLIKYLRGFREGARLDWLHPSHGPFPDFAAIYQDSETGEKLEVLAWDDNVSWVAMVCGSDTYHNGHPRSYRWWPDEPEPKSISCQPAKGKIFDVDVDWSGNMLKQVAAASVSLHMMTEPSLCWA